MHRTMILVALTASGAAVRLAPPLSRSTIPLQRRSRVVPVLLAPSLSEDRTKTGASSVADDRVTVSKLLALGRTRFLLYSPVSYAIGVAYAGSLGRISILSPAVLLGLLNVLCVHSMTHFFNEYFDYPTDCQHENPSPWTGGSKVLPRGLLQRRVALRAGWILAAFSCLFFTLPTMTLLSTASVGGVAAARMYGGIAALAVVLSIGYSAPPLRLNSRGLGELDVALVLNILTPLLGYAAAAAYVPGLSSAPPPRLLATLTPVCMVEYARMSVMNLADVKPDRATGKKTLPVRLGAARTKRMHSLVTVGAYPFTALLALVGAMSEASACAFLATLPLALTHVRSIARAAWSFKAPFWASQYNALSMVVTLLAFLAQAVPTMGSSQALLLAAVLLPSMTTWPLLCAEIGVHFRPWRS